MYLVDGSRFFAVLVQARGPDRVVSIKFSPPLPVAVEFLGRVFIATRARTAGGYPAYREKVA